MQEIGYHIIKTFLQLIYSCSEIDNKASQRVSVKIGMNKIKVFKSDGKDKVVYKYKASDLITIKYK